MGAPTSFRGNHGPFTEQARDASAARLTDARTLELVRLHDEEGWSFRVLGPHFGFSWSYARDVYRRYREDQELEDAWATIQALRRVEPLSIPD